MWRALAGLRHEGLVVLALVFAASAMVEGGIATWGILYLRGHLGLGVLAGVERLRRRREPGDVRPHRRRPDRSAGSGRGARS